MSEPIIIRTPAPDTEERLVLVPLLAVTVTPGGDDCLTVRSAAARDATPADLERAGYVPEKQPPHDPGCDTLDVGPNLGPSTKPCNCRKQPEDRATDEELLALAADAFQHRAHGGPVLDDLHKLARAVAARVRKECLVAQAVAAGVDLHVVARGGADERQVTVAKGRHMQRAYPDAADVPATLARLLGEVSR